METVYLGFPGLYRELALALRMCSRRGLRAAAEKASNPRRCQLVSAIPLAMEDFSLTSPTYTGCPKDVFSSRGQTPTYHQTNYLDEVLSRTLRG